MDIKYNIKELNYIKNSLIIFHKEAYDNEIKDLTIIIKDLETKPIYEFKTQKMRESIDKLMRLMPKCDEINKVKDFLLFKKILEISQGRNREELYNDGLRKLNELKNSFEKNSSNIEIIFQQYENIFKYIKEELSKEEESKSDEFIEQMVNYFDIKDVKTKKDLSIIIKSKKYEIVVKSIKFFFENFSNEKLTLPENIELSQMKLFDLKRTLKKLKDDNIYDYESDYSFYQIFTSFNEKKEAIDFLKDKTKTNIDYLKYKLDPTNKSISMKDIDDAIICLNTFKDLINRHNSEIINYLKYLDEEKIKKFVNYSKIYPSIIELDRKNEKNIFEEVYTMIENASLIFKMDDEYFYYKIEDKKIQKNIEELIELKNKINIEPENKNEGKKEKDEKKKDLYEIKCKKLIFFKNIVSNIEEIYDNIKILRTKGYNIPILIDISIKYPEIVYKFYKEDGEKDFEEVKNYLLKIKNN